jgi:hypothetical protein
VWADPDKYESWLANPLPRIQTDGVHFRGVYFTLFRYLLQSYTIADNIKAVGSPERLSESIKVLKPLLLMRIIGAYKMDQAMIFCRTKLDCDNLEEYMNACNTRKKGMYSFGHAQCCT